MVFRKENKADAFQRQISALRQQLGTDGEPVESDEITPYREESSDDLGFPPADESGFGTRDAAGYAFGSYSSAQTFDRPFDAPPAPPLAPAPLADEQTSVIAHDTAWKGDLQTDGTIHIHGRFDGTITARHDVYIAEEADVDAVVTAGTVVVAGLVKGSIRCGSRFEALPQGRIVGDVQAPTLVIHEGAVITGQFKMGGGGAAAEAGSAAPLVQRRAAPSG